MLFSDNKKIRGAYHRCSIGASDYNGWSGASFPRRCRELDVGIDDAILHNTCDASFETNRGIANLLPLFRALREVE
jgi:hypothetical protein